MDSNFDGSSKWYPFVLVLTEVDVGWFFSQNLVWFAVFLLFHEKYTLSWGFLRTKRVSSPSISLKMFLKGIIPDF